MPENAREILIEFMQFTNLDVINTKSLLDKIMLLNELPPFNLVFEEVGYETTNFIIELGPLFFIIIGSLFFILARALLRRLIRKKGDNCITRRIRKEINYRLIIIRFLLESCIELLIIAIISVLRVSNTSILIWPMFSSTVQTFQISRKVSQQYVPL